MERIWFIFQDNEVSGPFTTEEVQSDLTFERWKASKAKVWWRGQKIWVDITKWQEHFDEIVKALQQKPQEPIWYAESNGEPQGPMTLSQMTSYLRELETLEGVVLWRKGLEQWTSLFELEEIVDELGLQRRMSPRAPLEGSVKIQTDKISLDADIMEVSEGGFAIRNGDGLNLGDEVSVSIESPSLKDAVLSKAKVVYVKEDGTVGLKFDQLHVESKSNIVNYIRQFYDAQKDTNETLAA